MEEQTQRAGECDFPDQTAEEVIDRYADMVYRIALSKMGNRPDADDIFQEVFFKYIQKERRFGSEQHRKAWLIRVTLNCCKGFWLNPFQKRRALLEEIPEGTYEMDVEEHEIFQELMRLPAKLRVVMELYYGEELSVKEIAKSLSVSEENVRMRLSRGRRYLRLICEGQSAE